MIKNINQACHKLNKALGISLKLPEPGQNALRAAALQIGRASCRERV